VHAAASHLWDGDSDEYNVAYVRRLIPGIHVTLINLSYRKQGFYVQKGNPKEILNWKDLTRPSIKFLNQKKGCGSRVLLDEKLRKEKLNSTDIHGYEIEIASHLTLANAISKGEADVGLGSERATKHVENLDFIALQEERYDLILKSEAMDYPEVKTMLQLLNSSKFRKELLDISGDDYRDLGKIVAKV
ncbi:MAG: substrate-binding domain-containing protein, partial [Lachnospiraceae bacterium]|nr:substrate-binding domain-containing protein [Lachnospiraceae bacterium]